MTKLYVVCLTQPSNPQKPSALTSKCVFTSENKAKEFIPGFLEHIAEKVKDFDKAYEIVSSLQTLELEGDLSEVEPEVDGNTYVVQLQAKRVQDDVVVQYLSLKVFPDVADALSHVTEFREKAVTLGIDPTGLAITPLFLRVEL